MNPSPAFSRSAPRPRGVPVLFPLLALMLCGAKGAPPVQGPPLAGGLVQERELRGGETHVYPVDLQAGQFLRVQVQEQGIDLAVRLLDPSGAEITGMDSFSIGFGDSLEDLAAVTEVPGRYLVQIASESRASRPGRYRFEVAALRPATEGEDTLRSEAVQAAWKAFHPAPGKGSNEALERAVALWERLGESRRMAEILSGLGERRLSLSGRIREGGRELPALRLLVADSTRPRGEKLGNRGAQPRGHAAQRPWTPGGGEAAIHPGSRGLPGVREPEVRSRQPQQYRQARHCSGRISARQGVPPGIASKGPGSRRSGHSGSHPQQSGLCLQSDV